MTRFALVVSLVAAALAGAALAVALHHAPDPYRLVCGQDFHDAQTGQQVPMYVPCSEHRP